MKPKLDLKHTIYIVIVELCLSIWEVLSSMQERNLSV